MRVSRDLLRSRRAATAAEFALVLPVLLFFLFGIIDAGRLMWTWNKAEKATQVGARTAIVTNMIPSTLGALDFTNVGTPTNGGVAVSTAHFSAATCINTGCTCTGTVAALNCGFDAAAFNVVADRMYLIDHRIGRADVHVDYENVGLGFAGDPNGPDVAPLVTVSIQGLQFQPLLFALFSIPINLPTFRASLTLEDGAGTQSN